MDRLEGDVAELPAIARSKGFFQEAAERGISETAVRNIVERLGGQGIAKADLVTWRDGWIVAAERLLGKQSNGGTAFEAAHREAERLFREGQTTAASDPFMMLLDQDRNEAEQRQLVLLDKAIDFDLLGLEIQAAVEKLKIVRTICASDDADTRATLLYERASAKYKDGKDRGVNAALLFSIAAYRLVLEELTRDRVPLDWARTHEGRDVAVEGMHQVLVELADSVIMLIAEVRARINGTDG